MLQVLRIVLGENVSLVDELHEFRRKLSVVILLDVLDAAVVALVKQTVLLVEFSVSAHAFTEAETFWAAQDVEEQLDVLGVFETLVSSFLLHVQQLCQTLLDLRSEVANIGLHGRKPIVGEVILVLHRLEACCWIHEQDYSQLFLELLLEIVDQEVLELKGLLDDLCVFPSDVFQVSRVGLDVNLVNQKRKHVDNAGSSTDLEHSVIMLVDKSV